MFIIHEIKSYINFVKSIVVSIVSIKLHDKLFFFVSSLIILPIYKKCFSYILVIVVHNQIIQLKNRFLAETLKITKNNL